MTLSRPEDSTTPPARPFARILRRLIDVKPEELPALGWCWLYISSVLASYYILRPIRDQMGVAGGVNNLQWLFTGTLVVMIVLNIPYPALVKMLPRRQFIPLTYRFFAVTILAVRRRAAFRNARGDGVDRPLFLHLDVGVQSVRGLDLLGHGGRHLQRPSRASGCSDSSPPARRSAPSSAPR